MNEKQLREQIARIIYDNTAIDYEDVNINEVKDLIADLGMDSINIMQLLIDIETQFNFRFDDDLEYEAIKTIDLLCDFVMKKVLKKDEVT